MAPRGSLGVVLTWLNHTPPTLAKLTLPRGGEQGPGRGPAGILGACWRDVKTMPSGEPWEQNRSHGDSASLSWTLKKEYSSDQAGLEEHTGMRQDNPCRMGMGE